MPRSPAHFKIMVSVANHWKTADIYADNELFAIWVKLGIMAVARYADKTDDSFLLSGRDIIGLVSRVDEKGDLEELSVSNALRRFNRIIQVTYRTGKVQGPGVGRWGAGWGPAGGEPGASLRPEGGGWRATFPNFAKKQGFGKWNRTVTDPPSSSSSSSSSKNPPTPQPKTTPIQKAATALRRRGTTAPENLAPAERVMLSSWARAHSDPAIQRTGWDNRWMKNAVDACLGHFRADGKFKVNWYAACQNWIRRDCADGKAPSAKPMTDRERESRLVDLDQIGLQIEAAGVLLPPPPEKPH